tara:strand:+ start:821 stop:961 length:141 start_codon:yes stop_codon:yes gene_type:complete
VIAGIYSKYVEISREEYETLDLGCGLNAPWRARQGRAVDRAVDRAS